MLNKINVINLPHRIDRLLHFEEESKIQGFEYTVWEGVTKFKTPAQNISVAHKQIVRKAKEEKWPYALIAEDDCSFSCAGAWKYFLSKMPMNYDLYCGLVYDGLVYDKKIVSTKGMSGTNTLYAIHERFYDFFLSIDESKPLDRELGKFGNINEYIVCLPMVCSQSGGYSDNFKRKMFYEPYLQDKKLYGQ